MNDNDTSVLNRSFAILEQVQSDPMLVGSPIQAQLQILREALDYHLIDCERPLSPVEALHFLQRMASEVPQIQLKRSITPGEEYTDHVDLTLAYELVLNQVQRVSVLSTAFLGHLKAAQTKLSKNTAVSIWWAILAKVFQEATNDPNLISDKSLLIFAADQFNQVVDASKVELAAVIKATALLIANLKASLKLATEMFQLGRNQITISLADTRIPNAGTPDRAATTLQAPLTPSRATDSLLSALGLQSNVVPADLEQDNELPLAENVIAGSNVEQLSMAEFNMKSAAVDPNEDILDQNLARPQAIAADPEEFVFTKSAGRVNGKNILPEATTRAHRPGEALPVGFNINILTPGITGKHDGVILCKNKTKLHLQAQTDIRENGIWRYLGATEPLKRFESGKARATVKEPVTQVAEPLIQLDTFIPDIDTPTEDIPGEEPDDPEECHPTREPEALGEETAKPSFEGVDFNDDEIIGDEEDDAFEHTLSPAQDEPQSTCATIGDPADLDHLAS